MSKINNKNVTIAIALILMMTLSGTLVSIHTANAQVGVNQTVQTHAYLSIDPNPVGIGQPVTVTFWVEPVQPTMDQFHGYNVKITHPDGTTESKLPFHFSGVQTIQHFGYTPTSVGNYTFLFTYAGGVFPDETTHICQHQASQQLLSFNLSQFLPTPRSPTPTSYWTNPVNAQNRNRYQSQEIGYS